MAKRRLNIGFNLEFGISFDIRLLRESGGIFAQLREKNKVTR